MSSQKVMQPKVFAIGFVFVVWGAIVTSVMAPFASREVIPMHYIMSGQGEIESIRANFLERPYQPTVIPVPGLQISKEVVDRALSESLPVAARPHVSLMLHDARLWGSSFDFNKEFPNRTLRYKTSAEIFDYLLNGSKCKDFAVGRDKVRYLSESHFGVHVALMKDDASNEDRAETHFGQLATVLGLSGISASRAVTTDNGRVYNVEELLHDLAFNFTTDKELEFFALAMAMYLDDPYVC